MLSSILSSILFCTIVIGSIVYAKPVSSDLCNAYGYNQPDSCHLGLSLSYLCNSSTFNLSGTDTAKTCKSVMIFWSSPKNTLILIIATPFTQQHQSYSIRLQSQFFNSEMAYIYQVSENDTLTKLQPKGNTITIQSNADYQVILQLEIHTNLMMYGISIQYDVINNENY